MQARATTESVRLVLSSGGLVLRSVALTAPTLTIGRRPYNDIALDDLTVSGEHALVRREAEEIRLLDLGSRNGTWVNGVAVDDHPLQAGDRIAIGVYRLSFVVDAQAPPDGQADVPIAARPTHPFVEVLSGRRAGERIVFDQPITSLGSSGDQVAVIARRAAGYTITHLEGPAFPLVNGVPLGLAPHPLADADLIEIGGSIMRFGFGG